MNMAKLSMQRPGISARGMRSTLGITGAILNGGLGGGGSNSSNKNSYY